MIRYGRKPFDAEGGTLRKDDSSERPPGDR